MIFVSQVNYPPSSAEEMAKRFFEAPQIPGYINRIGPYFNSELGKGITGLSIWEVDEDRISEGFQFVGDYLAPYFGVPGFTYEIKSFFKVDEALKMIGMG